MRFRTTIAAGSLLLFGAAGCADLSVTNPNAPDTEGALATPGDVESLIAGAWVSWWRAQHNQDGFGIPVHVVALGHSAYPANFGMVDFSVIPRQEINNDPAYSFYAQFQYTYTNYYRAITATRDGLGALDGDVSLGANEPRARAFAHLVQGLAHGSLALLFDQAFVVDENTPLTPDGLPDVAPQPYGEVMSAALGYFDQAIAIAQQNSFTLPSSWMSREISNTELIRIAHSYKARFRASLARTPEERQAVDWSAVLADVSAGITQDFNIEHDGFGGRFASHPNVYGNFPGWSQLNNHTHGMADQSGGYQDWMGTHIDEREPFLYITPDLRYPQGSTVEAQQQNPGTHFLLPVSPAVAVALSSTLGDQWARPDRGTWRWSYYRDFRRDLWLAAPAYVGPLPEIPHREMRLLAAEAHYRMGNVAEAVLLIDESRTQYGLGTAAVNAQCVPRLPDGSCGGVLETLKWEKRNELRFPGQGWVVYYDNRGWGDLVEGTFLHLPIPSRELTLAGIPHYTFGGVGGEGAAPRGAYGF